MLAFQKMSRTLPKASEVIKRILMVRPTHFQVKYAINPWMDTKTPVDKTLASAQWTCLKDTIESVGGEVHVMESDNAHDYPDIVFAANAAVIRGNRVYLAHFHNKERQGERDFYKKWFDDNGFETVGSTDIAFEGAGDALWAGEGWNKLFVGIGPRSSHAALTDLRGELKDGTDFQVVGCHLIDQRYYHIDVAFCPLEERLALWFPDAYSPITRNNMKNHGVELLAITAEEATGFACNSVVVGKNVIMHNSPKNETVARKLEKVGYATHFVNMSEFIKAGGSAKCCTLQLP